MKMTDEMKGVIRVGDKFIDLETGDEINIRHALYKFNAI